MHAPVNNLVACCQEVLDWRRTGFLIDGELRKFADGLNVPPHSKLDVAEKLVTDAAMKYVVSNAPQPQSAPTTST